MCQQETLSKLSQKLQDEQRNPYWYRTSKQNTKSKQPKAISKATKKDYSKTIGMA